MNRAAKWELHEKKKLHDLKLQQEEKGVEASGVVDPAIQKLENRIQIASKRFEKAFNFDEEQRARLRAEHQAYNNKLAWEHWHWWCKTQRDCCQPWFPRPDVPFNPNSKNLKKAVYTPRYLAKLAAREEKQRDKRWKRTHSSRFYKGERGRSTPSFVFRAIETPPLDPTVEEGEIQEEFNIELLYV